LFVYDDLARPLAAARLRRVRGSVVNGDRAAAPLVLSTDGQYFEARIGAFELPARIVVEFSAAPGAAGERAELMFTSYSADVGLQKFEAPPTAIARTLAGILASLRVDDRETQALVQGNQVGMLYIPALRARDRVLALEPHLPKLAAGARAGAEAAIASAVRAAWLLHAAADNGTPVQAREAATLFRRALDHVASAFEGPRR
jgi:hypothetical protein